MEAPMIDQGTSGWHEARCGKFTASNFQSLMARNKKTGEPLKAYSDLIWTVVTERITQKQDEGIDGIALRWGRDLEPFAREAYELETGNIVTESGFIVHPKYPHVGCSPDGLIGTDGGLELKCPKSSIVHLERFISGVPAEYMPQIQGCMMVTGRQFWDFASYDPRMPESHRLLIIRVKRDEEFINKLELAIDDAENSARDLLNKLNQKAA